VSSSQLESDYSLAARNIYDIIRQPDKVEEEDGDEDIWESGEPTPLTQQCPPPVVPQQPTQKARTPPANESIINMLQPSRHIFRGWQHQTFPIHNDVGLDVARTIVLKLATATNQPKPAIPTTKDMRRIMMTQLWRNRTIEEINEGRCGPDMKRCLNDIISELGDMRERDMQKQITIRMNKTNQEPPPHYSIQDS
jgi:hypothetical protein